MKMSKRTWSIEPRPIADRLWEKAIPMENGCIFFTGSKNAKGYGHIRAGAPLRKSLYVHRVAYELETRHR